MHNAKCRASNAISSGNAASTSPASSAAATPRSAIDGSVPAPHANIGRSPQVAAGCIATGRQLAASLSLGAELAYMGTRFIASTECGADDAYKQAVINGRPEDIVYTDSVSGVHANFLRDTVPGLAVGDRHEAQREVQQGGAKKWKDIWSAGQGVALAKEVKPIGAIVEDIVREYVDATRGLPALEP